MLWRLQYCVQGVNLVLAFVAFEAIGTGAAAGLADGDFVDIACAADDVDLFAGTVCCAGASAANHDHPLCLGAGELLEECLGGLLAEDAEAFFVFLSGCAICLLLWLGFGLGR